MAKPLVPVPTPRPAYRVETTSAIGAGADARGVSECEKDNDCDCESAKDAEVSEEGAVDVLLMTLSMREDSPRGVVPFEWVGPVTDRGLLFPDALGPVSAERTEIGPERSDRASISGSE
jgi:hypothetical protein